jgi:hypothetical protein
VTEPADFYRIEIETDLSLADRRRRNRAALSVTSSASTCCAMASRSGSTDSAGLRRLQLRDRDVADPQRQRAAGDTGKNDARNVKIVE